MEAVIPAREAGFYWRIDFLRYQGVLVDEAGMELSAPAGLELLDSGGLRLLDAGGAVVFESHPVRARTIDAVPFQNGCTGLGLLFCRVISLLGGTR